MGLVDYDSDSETDLGLPLLPDHRKVKVIQKDQSENLPRNTQKRPLPSLPDTFNSGKPKCSIFRLSGGLW